MNKKKVLLILVEGPSDETTLAEPLSHVLDENTVYVKIQHGDILTVYRDGTREFKVNRTNVKGEIKKKFNEKISEIKSRYKLKNKDFLGVVYCTDIDNCNVLDEDYLKNKKECLSILFNLEKITLNNSKQEIDFKVVFFSKNLEHVFHNKKENLTDEEKENLSYEFIMSCKENDFLSKFEEIFKDKNVLTWKTFSEGYIKLWECSVDARATNLNCLIEYYKDFKDV